MVFTILHFPQAYLLYKAFKNKLSYPGLLIGSFLPDIEVPILMILGYEVDYARLVLHSIIGAFLFSWIIGLIMLPFYKLILRIFNVGNISIRVSTYALSIELGALIHVLIDSMHHKYNPLLWPITSENITILIPFGKQEEMHLLLHIVFLSLTIICIYDILRRNTIHDWKNILTKFLYNPLE